MSLHDFRKRPASQWTYYVVDHLPTMANTYRYDTPEEAIAQYRALDPSLHSAIGASIGGIHELDLIHRKSGNTPVFLTAADYIETSLWRESPEVQDAIAQIISELNVQHELNGDLFGVHLPSVIIDLARGNDRVPDSYFHNSILYPDIPKEYRSAIAEVFSMGNGWKDTDSFARLLRKSRSQSKDCFVERLSVRYINLDTGYSGEVDMSPTQYLLLREKTEQMLEPHRLAKDLYAFCLSAEQELPCMKGLNAQSCLDQISQDIAAYQLKDYRTVLRHILQDTDITPDTRQQAMSLFSRMQALTPKAFRRQDLAAKINSAEKVSAPRDRKTCAMHPGREEAR